MPEKHGYEQVSVSDMREELRRDFSEEASDNNLTLKKTPLALLLNELKRKKGDVIVDVEPSDEEPDFADMTVEVDESLDEVLGPASVGATDEDFSKIEVEVGEDTIADSVDLSTKSLIPAFNSPEWSDFVKSQLTIDEKQGEHPKCDGLRRLVEEFVGPIVSKRITQIKFPTINDNTASVAVAISYQVANRLHPLYEENNLLLEECVSDANLENNGSPPFSSHMSAVAETRAESRAYRRILRLKNTVSAEEMSGNELTGTTKSGGIEPIQVESIDRTCQRLDINVLKFLKTEGYEGVSQVSFDAAAKINKTLQEIGSEDKNRPEDVNGYNENWKGN